MITSNILAIGDAARFIGVSKKSMRRWDKNGLLNCSYRTPGTHRRYLKKDLLDFIKRKQKSIQKDKGKKEIPSLKETKTKYIAHRAVIYARVSSSRQKKAGDLKRQIETIKDYCLHHNFCVIKTYSDVGSGLKDTRKSLLRMLKDASLGKFETVVITYNDRLARFGLQIIREYLASWGVELIVIHPVIIHSSDHAELVTDLTAILYSFMGKLYRSRRTTQTRKKPINSL